MEGTVHQLRRTYRGEEKWFALLDDLGHRSLRDAFIEAGVSPQTAMGLVFFLDDQRNLDRRQSERSRVRYRDVLEGLDVASVARLATGAIPRQVKSAA
jgi:hypothetical protein